MEDIRKGTLVVLHNYEVDVFPDIMASRYVPIVRNVIGIVKEVDDAAYMTVVTNHGVFYDKPILGERENIIVLAQDADPEKDVREELVRLLPEAIINLAIAGREELYQLAVGKLDPEGFTL